MGELGINDEAGFNAGGSGGGAIASGHLIEI